VDERNPADELPELYRKVLDAVARLDAVGDHRSSYELRQRAYRTYAMHWNEKGRKGLQKILREADRQLSASTRSATQRFIARSV